MSHLRALASLKLTFAGMLALLAGVLWSYFSAEQPVIWIVAPLSLLALNLFAAIVFNPRIRQNGGLLIFHIALLALALLAALSQLTAMQGRVEIAQGSLFDASAMTTTSQGPWHSPRQLQQLEFEQGDIRVDYTPGLRRGNTRSQLFDANGAHVVGDNIAFERSGYRFYTSSNKGYAAVLAWRGQDGAAIQGAVHFPSYPLYDWKQENHWTTPAGQALKLAFRGGTAADPERDWSLDSRTARGELVIETADGIDTVLSPGQRLRLDGGQLEFVSVRMWMGYRIFYNPWLRWFFAAAIVAVLGLAWHFCARFGLIKQTGRCAQKPVRCGRVVPNV
jgi:hypothetical protein